MSEYGFNRWISPNNAEEAATANHIPKAIQSSRRMMPRNNSSSNTPERSEISSSLQIGAGVGPVTL